MRKKKKGTRADGAELPVQGVDYAIQDVDLALAFTNYVHSVDLFEAENRDAKAWAELLNRAAATLRDCPDNEDSLGGMQIVDGMNGDRLVKLDRSVRELNLDVESLRAQLVKNEDTRRLVEFLDRRIQFKEAA